MDRRVQASAAWDFQTQRLAVAHWRKPFNDERALANVVIDILSPTVTEFLPEAWRGNYTSERARLWIAERERESMPLIVLDRFAGDPIGLLIVAEDDDSSAGHDLRIGFIVAESAWGRGLATELLAGFVRRCRARGVSSVVGGVEAGNSASKRVMVKCGFREDTSAADGAQCVYRLVLG